MATFTTVDYLTITVPRTDIHFDEETGIWTDDDGNELTLGPGDTFAQKRLKSTRHWKTVDETDDPFDVLLHRDGGEPAVVLEVVGIDDDVVEQVRGHVYFVDGNEYREEGPSDVQGDDVLVMEYHYGDFTIKEALEIAYAQDLITKKEFEDGIKDYNELPKAMLRSDSEKKAFSKGRFPNKGKVKSIYNLLNRRPNKK